MLRYFKPSPKLAKFYILYKSKSRCTQVFLRSGIVGSHHLALVWVIESFQELNTCAFATTTTTHKGKSLTRAHFNLQSSQHLDVRPARIRKPAEFELDPTLKIILQQTRKRHNLYITKWSDVTWWQKGWNNWWSQKTRHQNHLNQYNIMCTITEVMTLWI